MAVTFPRYYVNAITTQLRAESSYLVLFGYLTSTVVLILQC